MRADINASMHKKDETAIPKHWRQTYLTDNKRSVYKETLNSVFVYYMFMYHYDKIDWTNSNHINNIVLLPQYQSILTQKISASVVPIENLRNLNQLVNIIINQLYVQCERAPLSSLQNQMDFFMSHIECYGDRSIDKLFALERYASQNVYCAYALADIYYYGSIFYSGQKENAIEIPSDYIKAATYYEYCTHEPNLIPAACWSLGYMYQNRLINSKFDNLKEATRLFKKCGNYPPALCNLGKIERTLGNDILFSKESFTCLNKNEQDACIKHYLSFIELNYSACCNDWVYAFNNLYDFYYAPKYSEIRQVLQKEKRFLNLEPLYLLQQAADMKNYWSMDTFALHQICDFLWDNYYSAQSEVDKETLFEDVKLGNISLNDLPAKIVNKFHKALQNAHSMLKELNNINYARGTFHLAIYFYHNSPIMGNLLKKAADQGYAPAQDKLEEIMKF